MRKIKKLYQKLRNFILYRQLKKLRSKLDRELAPFADQRVPYGELVGAPYPYCCQGDLTFGDPDLDMMMDIFESTDRYLQYLESTKNYKPSETCPFSEVEDENF